MALDEQKKEEVKEKAAEGWEKAKPYVKLLVEGSVAAGLGYLTGGPAGAATAGVGYLYRNGLFSEQVAQPLMNKLSTSLSSKSPLDKKK